MEPSSYYLMRALSNWAPAEVVTKSIEPERGSLQKLSDIVSEHLRYDVFSFDIFDTLIRRDVEPSGVPKREAMRLLNASLARLSCQFPFEKLLEMRDVAEHTARHRQTLTGADAECTLTEIFEQLYDSLRAENGVPIDGLIPIRELVETEVRAESKRLTAMPGAIETLESLRKLGKRVTLVSDMYLGKSDIEDYLRRVGLLPHVDDVFVSSDLRLNKNSGRIYQWLLEKGILKAGRTVHVGDNPISDVARAQEQGLDARLFQPKEELERRARLRAVRRTAFAMGDLSILENSISVDTREQEPLLESKAYQLGKHYLGPAFVLFALQLYERARKQHYRDVYFLARDGYVFRLLYDRIRQQLDRSLSVNTPPSRYVHVSRSVAKFASLEHLDTDIPTKVHATNRRWGLEELLRSFGLDPDGYGDFVNRMRASDDLSSNPLRELLRAEDFMGKLRGDHDRQKSLFRDYLVQQGILAPGRIMLVDVGWNGTIIDSLQQAFGALPEFPKIEVAFLGLERPRHRKSEHTSFLEGFVYDALRPNPIESVIFQSREALEFFLAPADGPVTGYHRVEGGAVEPTFGSAERDEKGSRLVEEVQRGVMDCCDKLLDLRERFSFEGEEFRPDALIRVARALTGRAQGLEDVFEEIEISLGWGRTNRVRLRDVLAMAPAGPLASVPIPISNEAMRIRIDADSPVGGGDAQGLVESLVRAVERLKGEGPIVVYGVGSVASLLAPSLLDRIEFFVDTNKGLQGRTFMGKPVFGVDALAQASGKTVFVTPIKRKAVIEPVLAPYALKSVFMDDLI